MTEIKLSALLHSIGRCILNSNNPLNMKSRQAAYRLIGQRSRWWRTSRLQSEAVAFLLLALGDEASEALVDVISGLYLLLCPSLHRTLVAHTVRHNLSIGELLSPLHIALADLENNPGSRTIMSIPREMRLFRSFSMNFAQNDLIFAQIFTTQESKVTVDHNEAFSNLVIRFADLLGIPEDQHIYILQHIFQSEVVSRVKALHILAMSIAKFTQSQPLKDGFDSSALSNALRYIDSDEIVTLIRQFYQDDVKEEESDQTQSSRTKDAKFKLGLIHHGCHHPFWVILLFSGFKHYSQDDATTDKNQKVRWQTISSMIDPIATSFDPGFRLAACATLKWTCISNKQVFFTNIFFHSHPF